MTKREQLLLAITGKTPKILEGFRAFDKGVAELKSKLEENIRLATLDEVSGKMNDLKKKMAFEPLLEAIHTLEEEFKTEIERLQSDVEAKTARMIEIAESKEEALEKKNELADDIEETRQQITEVVSQKTKELETLKKELMDADEKSDKETATKLTFLDTKIDKEVKNIVIRVDKNNNDLEALTKSLPALREELMTRINNKGGGSMNRKVTWNGVDYLTRYTDINWKAGAGITFTVANNNQTAMVDVTITATNAGGGIVRSINSVSTPTNASAAAGTDYVYLVTGTTQITLPTAVGNTNLYTIKNVGTGVVTIATTSAQTIDGNSTITMATQFTSVDIISDTANWNIT